ncbi:Probable GTP-binding protein HflX [Mycobacteroides abscessus subsp. abscessus]|nr:Probable GTP-binding protein HflX [Mycobacteroides abscessus subsp. abscessus]
MSRQAGGRAGGAGGGVGTRGPGETKIETDRRRIRERMSKLRREIRDMKKVRDTKRSRRLESDVPSVAIVGYTNAGKSSLLNAITGAGVLVQDALFATLEPTTRRGTFDDGREFVITDTVGFVRHLPTQLVEAFRSTLEEVADADLLVHVVDGSDMAPLAQIEAVRTVICDGELSPAQLVALEKAVKVIDRTALILDIFAQHATSREGKAQVSLAQMEYMLPRLRGWGESMSRQAGGRAGGAGGGVGTRGPGETKIETDRRRIRERMSKLRREIRDMKKVRDTKRSRRLESDVPSVAIVGYTNAGKSSLLNAITGAGVLVQDALFATLEPTTRRGTFDDGREFVITDTVGFVRHLPTQLVEAFRSTLEEVADADLLVHVVDGSDMAPLAQIEAVRTVIGEVVADHDASAAPELLVINKVDAAGDLALAQLRRALPKALFVSAHTGEGIATLREAIAEAVPRGDVPVDVVIPYERGDLVARMHAEGQVQSTEHLADGTRVVGRVPRALAAVLTAL